MSHRLTSPYTHPIRVTVWGEFRHEKRNPEVQEIYPDGMHQTIAGGLKEVGGSELFTVRTATLDEPEHGLTRAVLDETDVLTWWGHMAHGDVTDDIVDRVHERVLNGMGLVVLHSGHFSKIFKKLMGTTCNLKWREAGEKEVLWVSSPGHPIAAGIDEKFTLPQEEMYGEYFDVPAPEDTVFMSWFQHGEVFRSGLTYKRGAGKIFYFRPGHETYPSYKDKNVRRVIANACHWCAPTLATGTRPALKFGKQEAGWND